MIPGETVLSGAIHPGTKLEVMQTPNGYYLGFRDKDGVSYSRETIYFGSNAIAILHLDMLRHG